MPQNPVHLDSRGWNISTERRLSPGDVSDLRRSTPRKPRPANLELHFRLTMLGFVVAGIVGLLSGSPIEGIG